MKDQTILTGIKPTGSLHLGNYLGAIKPTLALAKNHPTYLFIADYHSLNTVKNPTELRELTYQMAAALLACGLDAEQTFMYCQSDIPEIFELTLLLNAFTAKGLLNRAHAYKAQVDKNNELNKTADEGINMGLFTYPVLMAADILMFNVDLVPVGKDQQQHIEMAVDMAQAVNNNYGTDIFKLPAASIQKEIATIVGLDGRKMSKSYNNTIPLFSTEKELKKQINKIKTNSQEMEEAKDPDECNVFALYKLFATPQEQNALAQRYRAGGMGWGEAKQELFRVVNAELAPKREMFYTLLDNKDHLDKILDETALKVRKTARANINKIRQIIGIRK